MKALLQVIALKKVYTCICHAKAHVNPKLMSSAITACIWSCCSCPAMAWIGL